MAIFAGQNLKNVREKAGPFCVVVVNHTYHHLGIQLLFYQTQFGVF